MTITREEREKMVVGSEERAISQPRRQGSNVASSLMGMLAGLGMFFLLSVLVTAAATLFDVEFDLLPTIGDLQQLSMIAFTTTAIILAVSAMVGGYVAGRIARYDGTLVGLGASLWLTLVFALFSGLALWIGSVSGALDGFDLAGGLSAIDTADLTTPAVIAGSGLIVVTLLGGLLGGRFGQTHEMPATDTVVDLREAEDTEETEVEDTRTSV